MTTTPERLERVARALAEYAGIPWEDLLAEARAAIEAHETALEVAGLVIVPREPTEKMLTCGHAKGMTAGAIWDDFTYELAKRVRMEFVPVCYRAMLNAALEVEDALEKAKGV